MTAYTLAWLLIVALFLSLKLTVLAAQGRSALARLGPWRLLGFVFLWPGMDLRPFKTVARQPLRRSEIVGLALGGFLNLAAGAALLWGLTQVSFVQDRLWLHVSAGLAGIALMVLFGAFDLLAAFWRGCGVWVEKQWQNPPASRSLAEYWSRRWNRAFHDFARDYIFRPLRRRLGSTAALVASFLFSGILHDVAISIPARGGYGLPTLYFCLQAAGIWIERRWLASRSQWIKRLWAGTVVLLPLALLFHGAFVHNVLLPQFEALGAGRRS